MRKKIKRKSTKPVEVVKEDPTSWSGFFKNYPRIIGMFILLLFLPPIGWFFAYKFSPYDKKTTIGISVVCTAFFVYAVFISPQHEWIDNAKLTRADFCTRYSEQATKLAPRLSLTIDEEKISANGENFSYKFNDNLEISAQVQNNFVREVTVTAEPKTTDDSFQALNSFGLVIATLSPELNQDKRGEILRELHMLDKSISDDLNESTESGRITYGVKTSSEKLIFTARINADF
ncbi:MAG: tripartite tricarboxylate transporter TctB family protein [Selenomonadaceae bacterium]|nr:tripartite tricarboxylate transporter TctB family protein [Selenomonadaceae bacterium]